MKIFQTSINSSIIEKNYYQEVFYLSFLERKKLPEGTFSCFRSPIIFEKRTQIFQNKKFIVCQIEFNKYLQNSIKKININRVMFGLLQYFPNKFERKKQNMEEDEDLPNQDKFTQFFKGILSELKIELPYHSIKQIYKEWKRPKINKSALTQKLAEVGLSDPENMRKLLSKLLESKKLQRKIIAKINQIQQVQEEYLLDLEELCLDLLIRKNNLDELLIMQRLQKDYSIYIEDQQQFFKALNKLIEKEILVDFIKPARELIKKQFQLFVDFPQEEQEEAVKFLFKRNEAYQQLNYTLSFLGVDDSLNFIKFVFNGINQNDISFQQIETKQEFIVRVKFFFFSNCPILKRRSIEDKIWSARAEKLAAQLYDEYKSKDLNKIKSILKQSKWPEFKDPDKISNQTILQIYKLQSIEQFAKDQSSIRLLKEHLDFKKALAKALNSYKLVTIPVNFNQLRQLTKHSGLSGERNKTELKRLLQAIKIQYDANFIDIFLALSNDEKIPQKINVFLNIFEFIQICNDCQYQCKFREDLLTQGLKKLFKQLNLLFKSALNKAKKGYRFQPIRREVDQYIGYQKRINLHPVLKAKYLQFRKEAQQKYRPLLQDWFSQQIKNIEKELKAKYIDEFQLDQNLKE